MGSTMDTGLVEAAKSQAATEAPEPTTTAVGGAEVKMVEIPRSIYDDAVEDNRQRNFVHAILEARSPHQVPAYTPPPVPTAVALQTKAEMEEGRKRVREFEANEEVRRKVRDAHQNDKWAQPKSVPVFRPADFVPDPKKPALKAGQSRNV